MRKAIVLLMILAMAGTAVAADLGATKQIVQKDGPTVVYNPPATARQGGDTILDAVAIPGLPYTNTGTTDGYFNDYDEVCPYSGSTSPDVVYSYMPAADMNISVDLCGSLYDTKTYIYDSLGGLVACDDDFHGFGGECGDWTSKIENAALTGGETYYIVVDGYGGSFGTYNIEVLEYIPPPPPEPCPLTCDPDAVDEGEPRLLDGYTDEYNGGCNSPEFGNPFQTIDWTNDTDGLPPYDGTAFLCGESGWYLSAAGGATRDTDWFKVYALETGMMTFTCEAEWPVFIFKLSPTDCNSTGVELQAETTGCAEAVLEFPVVAGEEVWLWVGPTDFVAPEGTNVREFYYFATVSNNMFDVVPNEEMSFGGVKALYR